MAALVEFMDTLFGGVAAGARATKSKVSHAPSKLTETERSATMTTYCAGGIFMLIVLVGFTDFDLSIVQLLSSFCMLMAFVLLSIKVESQNSAAGVSSRMLEMWLLTLFTRLSSTLIKRGYLPEDKSGEIMYQFLDVSIFFMLMRLVYTLQRQHRQTYQEKDDLHSIFWTIPPCILLGMCFHANLNRSPLFDTIWTTAQFMETFCMVPQLYMIAKVGGKVETYTSQFVVLMFISRIFAWIFWYTGYPELATGYVEDDNGVVSYGDFNYQGYLIMIGTTAQVLISADFMYYYGKAVASGRAVMVPSTDV